VYRLKLAAMGSAINKASKPVQTLPKQVPVPVLQDDTGKNETHSSFVRIDAGHLDTMMGLSGELLVGSRWISQHTDELVSLKRQQNLLIQQLGQLRDSLDAQAVNDTAQDCFQLLEQQAESCRTALTNRLNDVEDFDRRTHSLTDRLNHEVIAGRMRPFGEGTQGFARMVRDMAHELGKQVNLVIEGENTQVDRDILERIEAPLNHMLRNAVDHGIETPAERQQADKPETGTIKLRAYHNAGMLSIDVIDDGRGIDLTALRNRIVEREMITARVADELNESELLDFLYLPGFSTRDGVTEISGRGVGLDVVHSTIQELRGQIRSGSTVNEGLSIHLQLPLTLSVIRTLLVELDKEPYAFPMTRIDHIIKIEPDQIDTLAGKQFINLRNQAIGLVHAAQIFGLKQQLADSDELSVVIISDRNRCYGVVVDRLLGERELAIRSLDERLGKIQDISAAAVLEDGQPTLIVDIDDMLRSIEKLSSSTVLQSITHTSQTTAQQSVKRVLVVDDSLTVREAERKMIEARGYQVELAVDGMDGWNTFREGDFDLVVSDIDMPRMNGIEFISLIKQDEAYRDTPVMIVSYKDREEDRMLGLEAGADYYLTKGSFHDESLLDAINDLIGPA
ncbi:MAG TPA: hybrid sensor histidine kinase/response regulator, partial [Gammaproteobacteria bacterium]|nr:hybrid sensor histidine kinase/response regulator [Gammaproteobacteria bacterium]